MRNPCQPSWDSVEWARSRECERPRERRVVDPLRAVSHSKLRSEPLKARISVGASALREMAAIACVTITMDASRWQPPLSGHAICL